MLMTWIDTVLCPYLGDKRYQHAPVNLLYSYLYLNTSQESLDCTLQGQDVNSSISTKWWPNHPLYTQYSASIVSN
jgi:hypothetical protein